ncbi:UNVERIFIED_CONTAM: hypothetical protein H355_007012 [Colinus virginianus]|nr:hypothetical protein H355_007012 [Colinus virginianus]
MMNHFVFLAVLLHLRTAYSQQESLVFPVTYLNVHKDLALQQLLVEWDVGKSAHDAELVMSFEIQVRRADEAIVWTYNSSGTQLYRNSITLGGLQPYTSYTARQETGFQANGEIISYEVTWKKVVDRSKPKHISLSSDRNSTRISIDNHPYRISIKARNSVGYSHPSVMIIPGAADTEKKLSSSELKEEHVNGTGNGILISWKPRDKSDSYIIDWCNFPMLQPCDLQWKRFGPNTSSALIKSAAFVPGVRYNFHIYVSAANRASLLEKKTGYLKELPPRFDPDVKKVELGYHEVTLYWDAYPTDEMHPGFLRGYHVYVSPVQEDCNLKGSKKHVLAGGSVLCKFTIENPEEKSYTVKHLMSNTKYKLAVKAYTGGGETPIINFRYIDTPTDSRMLYLLVLFVVVPSLIMAVCLWKMKWVKDCCCPVIPSPNKSKVLSFQEFKIGSEKVLKLSDCIPDTLALDNRAETKKLHQQSLMSSTPTEDKMDDENLSSVYHNKNEEKSFTSTPTPQTHMWFENFAYSSHLAVETNPYKALEMMDIGRGEPSAALYQPQYYLNILNGAAASSPGEAAGRRNNLRYISQTDVHCIGRRL